MPKGNLEDLKELLALSESDLIALEDQGDTERRFQRETALNRMLDLATDLSYTYPKDAYEIWNAHVPATEAVPSILRMAYDRLSPEEKASKVSAIAEAALRETRSYNTPMVIGRVLDRLDAKYPGASKLTDIEKDLGQAALYKEIVSLYAEKDFPEGVNVEELPLLEDVLALTQFLDRHNDEAQRAELLTMAAAYVEKVAPSVPKEQMDFGNVLEVEDAEKIAFASLEELQDFTKALAKEERVIPLPQYEAVVYVDKITDSLTLAAKSQRDLYDIEALTLGGDGKEAERQSSSGNKMVFNSKDGSVAVPALSIALVRLKLNEKEIHEVQTAIREITKPKPVDISEETMKRAYELRLQRRRAQELAARELEKAAVSAPVNNPAEQAITREDAFTYASPAEKVIPPQIARAYLKVAEKGGDKYYLSNRLDTVAFVDKGNKLETKSDNENTAEALVLIADARGWDNLKVSGTEAFRREVWLEASARGIAVRGYTPTDVDKALLAKKAEKVEKLERNAIERVTSHEKATAPVASLKAVDKAPAVATPAKASDKAAQPSKEAAAKVFSGTLLEHGKAPFEFDAGNKPNYYVKYQDETGVERVTWGLDLERAMQESKAQKGDKITLQNEGRKPVEVEANVKDDSGKVVGTKKITTHRNSWSVAVAKDFLQMPTKDFAAKHPDHVSAAALNEFTKKVVAESPKFQHMSDAEKARFTSGVQNKIAKTLENDKKINPLKLIVKTQEKVVVPERAPDRGRSR